MLCFNDDIQGTGAVVAAGFFKAVQVTEKPFSEHKLAFFGAGSAAVGVAEAIVTLMIQEEGGKLSREETRKRFYFIDSRGLVTSNRGDTLASHKVPFARDDVETQITDLVDIIKEIKPTALVGLSGFQGGVFSLVQFVSLLCLFQQDEKIISFSLP